MTPLVPLLTVKQRRPSLSFSAEVPRICMDLLVLVKIGLRSSLAQTRPSRYFYPNRISLFTPSEMCFPKSHIAHTTHTHNTKTIFLFRRQKNGQNGQSSSQKNHEHKFTEQLLLLLGTHTLSLSYQSPSQMVN
mmetsp:Transcript_21739/g.32006  ORF Transcript_21739/g.32006 Transcript_21739/m.32006 type:complete len:133 (-) Transcript_21739:33-431(-)